MRLKECLRFRKVRPIDLHLTESSSADQSDSMPHIGRRRTSRTDPPPPRKLTSPLVNFSCAYFLQLGEHIELFTPLFRDTYKRFNALQRYASGMLFPFSQLSMRPLVLELSRDILLCRGGGVCLCVCDVAILLY